MAELSGKVENSLDEARILVLGTQVLLGFQYRAFMEPGFARLPAHTRNIELAGLALLLASLAFLLAPVAQHRIVERGWDSDRLLGFTMNSLCCALLPFAAGLSLDLFAAGEHVVGHGFGIGAAVAAAACMAVLWYAVPLLRQRRDPRQGQEDRMSKPKLEHRIVEVLTEARVVLPGAQALLGFQLAMVLMDAFDKLSPAARAVHFASLCCIALATALLMAPPAFHRLAEKGEDTDRLERFSSAMVLSALVALAAGLSLEVAVITEKWNGSLPLGLILAAACFAALMAGWFGVSLLLRERAPAGRGVRAEA
ncbi:MAG TPA: DUF6328 family protein [Myxococcales bacterium]|nr:DUF6328 family protein [Myxococcales bacterium]